MVDPTVREEQPRDCVAIRDVHRRAFGGEAEGVLVERLRAGGYVRVSLVAEVNGIVVGHILFSDLPIVTEHGAIPAVGLAPMAVVPEHQGKGIGSALVRAGLDACRAQGYRAAIVLGHRSFYPRFGFSAPVARQFESRYAGDDFMAAELVPGSLSGVRGRVDYPPPFDEVSEGSTPRST